MRFRKVMDELHRRSVWQVLGGYSVIAWVVHRVSVELNDLTELPFWFGHAVAIAVLLGFPILLITTWIQGGFKKDEFVPSHSWDSATGGDDSLSSWRSLERQPVKEALRIVFTWRNAVAGGILMAFLLGIGAFL